MRESVHKMSQKQKKVEASKQKPALFFKTQKFSFKEENFLPKLAAPKTLYPNCDASIWLRSCRDEVVEPLNGTIKGTIPTWLQGTLYRNGPGSIRAGKEEFTHLFDSSALIHSYKIANGNVTYRSRFVNSSTFEKNWSCRRIVTSQFGTKALPDPCRTIFQKISSVFSPKMEPDNPLISIYPFNDDIYAFGEIPIIYKINKETLKTEGRVNMADYVSIKNHSSHPLVTNTGDTFNLCMSADITGPHYNIVHFPAPKKGSSCTQFQEAKIVASVSPRWKIHPSYMHTFGMTENYFITVEQPLCISLLSIISTHLKNDPLINCFRWFQNEQTQFNIISKTTGKTVAKFYSNPFFYLHIINQYEINNYIVIDICTYDDPSMLGCMYVKAIEKMHENPDYATMFRARPTRFVIPLDSNFKSQRNFENIITLENTNAKAFYLPDGKVFLMPEVLCNLGCETPRIHYEKYLGKPYRYFYAISADVDAENSGTLIKVDTKLKKVKTWSEKNCYPSEPIFVPSPTSKREDDGVLLSALVWGADDTNRVGLIILDARSLKELARTEFCTNGPVPKCLHGWYLPKN